MLKNRLVRALAWGFVPVLLGVAAVMFLHSLHAVFDNGLFVVFIFAVVLGLVMSVLFYMQD